MCRFRLTGQSVYKDKAVRCLDWLDRNKAPNYHFHSWGNHFDFSSRGGRLPKFEPIIVWTSLIGQAYLDAYEILSEARFLDVAKSICDWIMDLPRELTQNGTCLSYVAYTQESIHNSNMLGAAVLARTAKILFELSNQGQTPINRHKHTNNQMAAQIATVPEAFSRALKLLRDMGAITCCEKVIQVIDTEKLSQAAMITPLEIKGG